MRATRTLFPLILLPATLALSTRLRPPAKGVQLANMILGDHDIRFPLTVAQCEPVSIYYNTVSAAYLRLETPDRQTNLLNIYVPTGVGYLQWICDIHAGDAVIVSFHSSGSYVIQPGSSSSCLSNVTSTQYSSQASALLPTVAQPPTTVPFPTGPFQTINVYPRLAAESPTFAFQSSPPLHRSNTSAIAGGTVGGVIVLVITVCAVFFILRKRRPSRQLEIIDEPIATFPPVEQTRFIKDPSAPVVASWPSPPAFSSVPPAADWHPSMLLSEQDTPASGRIEKYPQNGVGPRQVLNELPTEKNLHSTIAPNEQHIPSTSKSMYSQGTISGPDTPNLRVAQNTATSSTSADLEHDDAHVVSALRSFSQMNATQKVSLVSMLNTLAPTEASPSMTDDFAAHPPPSYSE